jgi:hypothetical protein
VKVVIATEHYGLLPFAWRLRSEGNDVHVVVWNDRYERCWDGLLDQKIKGREKSKKNITRVFGEDENLVVLADSKKGEEKFSEVLAKESNILFGTSSHQTASTKTNLAVGGWFDGEHLTSQHLLVPDWGVWPTGLGDQRLGGLTLVWDETLDVDLSAHLEPLKSSGFRGLVTCWANYDTLLRDWVVLGMETGWTFLHSHAFISELDSFSSVLEGNPPIPGKKFVVALPLSVPPWPVLTNLPPEAVKLSGLKTKDLEGIFFHDFMAGEDRFPWTAGMDGLIGVVQGSANTFKLAQARALELAGKVELPNKQYRPDVGNYVDSALAMVEGLQELIALPLAE